MTVETLPNAQSLRKELDQTRREIDRHIENADDVTDTLHKLEQRFKETIGLLRALEQIAEAQTVETVDIVSKAIRRDYRQIMSEFMKLESRCAGRCEKSYAEREKAIA